ncbi:MAG: diguanylate cyclase, partial [Planctomycetaceae bacterium]|nr:diguanylate cyclase [Planctomycetaceae bacterium]
MMSHPSVTPFSSSEEQNVPRDDRRFPLALVVDDEWVNVEILANILHHHDFQTRKARDGQTALQIVAEEQVDLVLLDIAMPSVDGFAVLRQIRKQWTETELPVIMVAGSSESDHIVEAFGLGANDYLTKPVDVAVTMARITTQMRLKDAQAALRESEERYFLAARGTNDGLWDWNLRSGAVYYSPRWRDMLGLDESENASTKDEWLTRIHPEDRPRVESVLNEHLEGQTPHFEAELRMEHRRDGYRWMLCRGLAVRDVDNSAYRIAGSLTDITEGKVADALTRLPNRVLLLERLQRNIDRYHQHAEHRCALLYLDLDNFKLVNDSLGHNAGDQLLVALARRLEGCVRTTDSVVSRLGGDEFAVLLERIDSEQDAIRIAKRIIESIAPPFTIGGGREIYTSASVGIGIISERCREPVDLMQEAD